MMAKPKPVVLEARSGGSRLTTAATLGAALVLGALGGGLVGAGVGETTEASNQLSAMVGALDTVAKDVQNLIADVQNVGDQFKTIARAPATVPPSATTTPEATPRPAIVPPTSPPVKPTPAPTPRPTPRPMVLN